MSAAEEVVSPPCQRCGKALAISIGESSGIFNSNMSIQCFNCGHVNEMNGSLYPQRIGGRLRLIFDDMTSDELTVLRTTLETLRDQPDATIESVVEAVEPVNSRVAEWIRTLNANPGVLAVIGILLVMIQIFQATLTEPNAPPVSINQSINQTINVMESDAPKEIPRRKPCFCGSGKRYKNCCGRYPGAGAAVNPQLPASW